MSIGPLFDAGFTAGQKTAMAEIERLRSVLHDIIDLDQHNHGPESRATQIARAALNGTDQQIEDRG